jgi:hypothetical protein
MARRCGCKVYKLEARIRKRHQGEHEKNKFYGQLLKFGCVFWVFVGF